MFNSGLHLCMCKRHGGHGGHLAIKVVTSGKWVSGDCTWSPLSHALRASCTACDVKLPMASGPPRVAMAAIARHARCTTTASVCGAASSAWNLALQVTR